MTESVEATQRVGNPEINARRFWELRGIKSWLGESYTPVIYLMDVLRQHGAVLWALPEEGDRHE